MQGAIGVDTYNLVAGFSEAGGGHETDIPGTDDSDLHASPPRCRRAPACRKSHTHLLSDSVSCEHWPVAARYSTSRKEPSCGLLGLGRQM